MAASYRVKNRPEGWFEPWIWLWQLVQERLTMRLLARSGRSYSVLGCPDITWQRWHRNGRLPASTLSLFAPCGSWQVTQFSRTGACSHRNGPRLSEWQLSQSSLFDDARSMLFVAVP